MSPRILQRHLHHLVSRLHIVNRVPQFLQQTAIRRLPLAGYRLQHMVQETDNTAQHSTIPLSHPRYGRWLHRGEWGLRNQCDHAQQMMSGPCCQAPNAACWATRYGSPVRMCVVVCTLFGVVDKQRCLIPLRRSTEAKTKPSSLPLAPGQHSHAHLPTTTPPRQACFVEDVHGRAADPGPVR
jgi:hypothetical protein